MSEQRIAKRIIVNAPVQFANIAQSDPVLHPALAAVYSRVEASREHMGRQFSGTVRDVPTNGAFIVGPPLPLLSRISLSFALDGIGQLEGVGWVMWRRDADCSFETTTGPAFFAAGFGVLFEAMPLDARAAIAALVHRQ